jgi:hypothetical protein
MVPTAVTASDAQDDYVTGRVPIQGSWPFDTIPVVAVVPQDYVLEQDADGNRVIYTDQADATLRYQAVMTDAASFPPLFKMAVSWQLAAMLAGPLLKGEAGSAEAKRSTMMMATFLAQASETDANQRQVKPRRKAPWMERR